MFTHKTSSPVVALALALLLALTAVACHRDGLSREERRARRAAEQFYEWLQKGRVDKFVGHIAYADSMSDGYRAEMCDLVAEHLAALEQQHGKLTSVRAVGQTVADDRAHVYLQLSFADSTSEEVGLPLVKVESKWLMQ